jgi:hypothetical protein
MASKKRLVIGSVIKGKEKGDPDYIKIRKNISLKEGEVLRLESKAQQISQVKTAIESGKLTPELGEEILSRLEKIPDFVRFEISKLVDK